MPENFKTLCGSSSPRQEYGFGDEDLLYVSILSFFGEIHIYGTLHLKRNVNLMSASDDYHRHRLRTATKYFKVSVKPFQRLAECEAEPHEERLGGVWGGSPEKDAWRSVRQSLTKKGLAGAGR